MNQDLINRIVGVISKYEPEVVEYLVGYLENFDITEEYDKFPLLKMADKLIYCQFMDKAYAMIDHVVECDKRFRQGYPVTLTANAFNTAVQAGILAPKRWELNHVTNILKFAGLKFTLRRDKIYPRYRTWIRPPEYKHRPASFFKKIFYDNVLKTLGPERAAKLGEIKEDDL